MSDPQQSEQQSGYPLAQPYASGWVWFARGFKHAARLPMFVMALTFLGIGSLAYEADVSLAFALASTFLIWAGPAQVIFFGAVIQGLSLPAIALSVSLSSVRLMPMCVSLLPLLRRRDQGVAMSLYTAHHIAVTGWVESIRRLPGMPEHARLPWFLGLVHGLYFAASIATVTGYMLSASVPRELAAGLLFVTPIYFIAALFRNAREPMDWMALVFGFALSPLLKPLVSAGFDLLAVGLIGGTAAFVGQRWLNARRVSRAP
ncbi:MAG: AzlC family ABC transporter permease [Beijerinckiaceae bacterium]|nr:AzlC family ABC transporter permease [Beijerinckiaceae bacterium]